MLQRILNNQEKILNQLAAVGKAINDLQDGQRTLYVGQRNLEMDVKETSAELKFLKYTIKDEVVKKINVLVDDAQKQATVNTQQATGLYEEFAKLKATVTDEDIKSFEEAKCHVEKK